MKCREEQRRRGCGVRRFGRAGAGVLLVGAVALLSACAGSRLEPEKAMQYPAEARRGDTLSAQAIRDGTHITITNTTTRDFRDATLWINMRFGKRIGPLAPGQTITLHLGEFYDEHGEPFRAGGFFATQLPGRLALLEVQDAGETPPTLLGLITIDGAPR